MEGDFNFALGITKQKPIKMRSNFSLPNACVLMQCVNAVALIYLIALGHENSIYCLLAVPLHETCILFLWFSWQWCSDIFVPFVLGSDLTGEDNFWLRPLELNLSNVAEIFTKLLSSQNCKAWKVSMLFCTSCYMLWQMCEKESCSGTPAELCSSQGLLEMRFFLCAFLGV